MWQYYVSWIRTWLGVRRPMGELGQDLAEYALLIALIALIVIAVVAMLGREIYNVFNGITTNFAAHPLDW